MISEHAALTELVALEELKGKIAFLRAHPYKKVEADRLDDEYRNRYQLAWENARLALRLSQVNWDVSW